MIKGIYAASLSLLNEDLALDCKKTITHAENIIDNGCHGVVFFGSTGQSQLISLSEKRPFLIIKPFFSKSSTIIFLTIKNENVLTF